MLRPLDRHGQPLDLIRIEGLRAECIVGVYARERSRPQPVELEVALHLDTRRAATEGRIRDTVDYARLSGELRFLLRACRFPLLETAAEGLCRHALAPPPADLARAQVEAITLRLTKPLGGGEAGGVPSIEIHRRADACAPEVEAAPFGAVDVLHRGAGARISRLRIAPGGQVALGGDAAPVEDLILGSGLLLDGRPIAAGTARRWTPGAAHLYENPQAAERTVLRVQRAARPDEDAGAEALDGALFYPREAPLEP